MKDIYCYQTLATTNHRVLASDLNEHETVYGGRLLEMLDGTASISATRLAKTNTVTASIDDLNFIAPFALNDSFEIKTYVSGVGSRSIEVFAMIIGEHLFSGERFLGLTAFLTFVVSDKTKILPKIIATSPEENFICSGYQQRKQHKITNIKAQKEIQSLICSSLSFDKC